MGELTGKKAVVTGGSRGLGLGITEALLARGAEVTVVARDRGRLQEVAGRLGVATVAGDIADERLAASVLAELRPDILVLNAGATPTMAPIDELDFAQLSAVWNCDVQAGLHWMKHALRLPLRPGSRVLVGSSGAAVNGSPLSGGYAGAKRMLWLMSKYAAGVSAERKLGISFQALLPMQMIGETDLGKAAASAYAASKGVPLERFLEGFGARMPPRAYGEHVATILLDPKYAAASAFGLKGDSGVTVLDG
jgi:NAD(P)-dependent dehydrogenase (short-subunit alcohol dehydrogenase family)